MWLAGSAAGNVVRVGVDVAEETARAIEALAVREPPMVDADAVPVHLDEYSALLEAEAPVYEIERDVTYTMPRSLRHGGDLRVISSDTEEGVELLARLDVRGLPDDLVEMGFEDASHLWAPWTLAVVDGTIVSVAFTARLSSAGAEVGVATPTRFRGRGFAAAVTAEWTSVPSLADRALFYSTRLSNVSSLRVVERLRLPLLGPSVSIR